MPKKNGKSALFSGLSLYLLAADGEPGAEVYSAAVDRDQASIVFNADDDMTIPDDTGPGASKGQYPKWMQKQFEMQAAAAGLPIEKVIENYTKEQAKASNGAGRY